MKVDALKDFWEGRSPREQGLLGFLFLLLLAVALYGLLWQPAANQVQRLEAALPTLRLDLARMQGMAAELSRRRAPQAAAAAVSIPLQDRLRQSLDAAGLAQAGLETGEGGRVRVNLREIPFSTMADWVSALRQNAQATVFAAQIERANGIGKVNARLEIQPVDASR